MRLSLLFVILLTEVSFGQSADAIATVNVNTVINPRSSLLLGITFDARSSMRGNSGPVGYHDTNGVILPEIQTIFGDFPMSTLRYPANAVMSGFDWKKSVGPAAKRQSQDIGGNVPSQPLKFGFDEFMAMTKSRGALPKDIQIMVTIYSKSTSGLKLIQSQAAIDDPAQSAADLVEYANAPNNGKNWGGGIDWAAVRDSNGHPEPYGIEIWNLGNEPWASGEFGNDSVGANNYVAMIQPILDSMLLRDPTIKITVPATGPATSQWNTKMMNHPSLKGKLYGLSPHFFPDETVVNGTLGLGIAKVESGIIAIADSAKAKGLKVIVGDYAHNVPTLNGVPTGNPDLAMQWQGANLCADFLLLMSQIKNVERVNFWAYGLVPATWHPIRLNSPGNYTLMPAAALYKKLSQLFLDRSVAVTTTSPKGSDGNSYSVRAGAFISSDSSLLNVIAVNRDKNDSHIFQTNGLSNYSVTTSRLLTATSLTSEIILDNTVASDPAGNFTLSPMSVLILQYQKKKPTAVNHNGVNVSTFLLYQNYPNPFNPTTTIGFTIQESGFTSLKIFDALGREVTTLVNEHLEANVSHQKTFDASALAGGVYFYRLTNNSRSEMKKMVLLK
ncbi:MAG: T9SS type A sorting domain-containing protein [Bacteroidota bacterium]